ncbi:MAG: spore maturation protein A [Oscillospiraceae bacterium]|nr:spore maturation protein A [Oscillospiraceae bacterium]
MMTWLFAGLVVLAVCFGAGTGRMGEVSGAALAGCGDAVELFLTLLGTMALWGGAMRVAEKAKVTEKLAGLLWPVLSKLFPDVKKGSGAAKAICMNVISNIFGLGNAATPLGLLAMQEMQRDNPTPDTASDSMVNFLVLNTACIQLIPTTTAALRAKYGSGAPLEILPCVLVTSLCSLALALMMAFLLGGLGKRRAPAYGRREAVRG